MDFIFFHQKKGNLSTRDIIESLNDRFAEARIPRVDPCVRSTANNPPLEIDEELKMRRVIQCFHTTSDLVIKCFNIETLESKRHSGIKYILHQ